MNNERDIRLWQRIRQGGGNLQAFRELFDRYYAPLCRFAAYWLRDRGAAEEIVLDVFTHLWQHAAELRIDLSVRAYLFRAVRNRSLNRLRDDRLRNIPFDELEPLLADNPNHRIETEDLMRLVAEAVADLPLRCREVYLKSREEELSNAEIARELSISVKTVEAQITKALRRIRHRIGEA